MKQGELKEYYSQEELNSYMVIGNKTAPLFVGQRKEIPKFVDSEYWDIWDLYRWNKSGMIDLKLDSDYPLRVLRAVRVLDEIKRG